MSLEVNLKYGDRDISESSLVFPRSKDEEAGGKPLLSQSATKNYLFEIGIIKIIMKEKCLPVVDERSLHSYEMFIAVKDPKSDTISTKVL